MVRRICKKCYRNFVYGEKPCNLHRGTTIGQGVVVGDNLNPTEQESPKEHSPSCGSKSPVLTNDVQITKPHIHDRKRIVTDDQKCNRQPKSSLPNTYLKSSINVNTFGDGAEKSNRKLIQPKKINYSSSDNHYEEKDVLKKADLDQETRSSVKSRRNLFKQKVPEKRLLEIGKLSLAGSISYQAECSLPNTNVESSKNENTMGDSSEKSNSYLVPSEKRKKSPRDNHYEGIAMIKNVDSDHSSGKSRRNLFKQKVPEKRSLVCGKGTSRETVETRSIAVPFHLEKEAILPSSTILKKTSPSKNNFPEGELNSSGISHANVLKVKVPVNQLLKCGKCGKLFISTWRLKVHMELKCDAGPYKCDHCDKQYPSEYRLIEHRLVHFIRKPFKCDQCCYASKWEKNLLRHKKGYHQK